MKKGMLIFWIFILVLVVVGVGASVLVKSSPGQLDGFTQCLQDEDVTFFGAFWCPNCQQQKRLFGKSVNILPYVECSTPDGQSQLQVCVDEGIQSYPTWEFADGSRLIGVTPLDQLAEKTGCELPQ